MSLSPSAPFRTVNAWAAAVAVSLLFAIGLATAPIATADTCDNATLRAQNNSTGLPDCRAYEMVSSPYKEGFIADSAVNLRFTDDGVFSYGSLGTFAGNQSPALLNRYHATRSAAGWVNRSVSLNGEVYYARGNTAEAESADLRSSVWLVQRRLDVPGDTVGSYLRGPDGAVTRIGDARNAGGDLGFAGASPDLSHVVYTQVTSPLWEHVGTGNGPPRTVSVDNNGQEQGACFHHISPDGRVIAYSTGCPFGTAQVWARIGGSVSVAVSGSECTRTADDPGGLCNNDVSAAYYVGGAVDGSRVFFTTSQQLVNGDTDTGNDLYACDIPAGVPMPVGAGNPCASLTQVSGTASDAGVENVVAISEDGSRVYFVAQGAALADNLGVNDAAPVAGESNLYLWIKDAAHPAGTMRFVAGLSAGNDLAGGQLTPDGRYLLFRTASKLVTDGPGADNDTQVDAYRYDAVTRAVVRVSTSVTGGGGNGSGFDVTASSLGSLMSADGSTVIFDTAEALSVADTDGVTDVYSWRDDGGVSLISAGGGRSLGITSSGRDIFFATDVQVLAGDRDVLTDIYTARVGGGFAPVQTTSCSGDGCQGLLSGAPGLAGPRSGSSGDSDPEDAAAVLSLRAVSAAQRRRLAATGKLALTVAANAAGRVSATARAKIAGRSVTVGSGRRMMTTPGSMAVTLKLSRKARGQLAARGRLTVKVVVSHSKAAKRRSVTLKLTKAKAKKSSSVGGRS